MGYSKSGGGRQGSGTHSRHGKGNNNRKTSKEMSGPASGSNSQPNEGSQQGSLVHYTKTFTNNVLCLSMETFVDEAWFEERLLAKYQQNITQVLMHVTPILSLSVIASSLVRNILHCVSSLPNLDVNKRLKMKCEKLLEKSSSLSTILPVCISTKVMETFTNRVENIIAILKHLSQERSEAVQPIEDQILMLREQFDAKLEDLRKAIEGQRLLLDRLESRLKIKSSIDACRSAFRLLEEANKQKEVYEDICDQYQQAGLLFEQVAKDSEIEREAVLQEEQQACVVIMDKMVQPFVKICHSLAQKRKQLSSIADLTSEEVILISKYIMILNKSDWYTSFGVCINQATEQQQQQKQHQQQQSQGQRQQRQQQQQQQQQRQKQHQTSSQQQHQQQQQQQQQVHQQQNVSVNDLFRFLLLISDEDKVVSKLLKRKATRRGGGKGGGKGGRSGSGGGGGGGERERLTSHHLDYKVLLDCLQRWHISESELRHIHSNDYFHTKVHSLRELETEFRQLQKQFSRATMKYRKAVMFYHTCLSNFNLVRLEVARLCQQEFKLRVELLPPPPTSPQDQ